MLCRYQRLPTVEERELKKELAIWVSPIVI